MTYYAIYKDHLLFRPILFSSFISLTHPPLGHGEMALSNRQILYFTRGKAEKAIYCYSKKAQINSFGQAVTRSSLEREVGYMVQTSARLNQTQCCQRFSATAKFLLKELCNPGEMMRRWTPQTRYTLPRRIKKNLI